MSEKMNIKLPYGKETLKFSLPNEKVLGVLRKELKKRRESILSLFRRSLNNVVKSRRLEDLVLGKKKVLIVVPDSTRSAHLKEILPILIKKVESEGRRIAIIIATGMHRKHNIRQIRGLVGSMIADKYRVLNHDQDKKNLKYFGRTKKGVPVELNRELTKHDLIISIGVIEPHLYAGYSGGAKTVAVGLAGKEIIKATHSTRFLDDPLTKIGFVKDNPFQEELWEIAGRVKVDFAVNIVNDADGKCIKIFSGNSRAVFNKGVEFSRSLFEVRAKETADIVVCGIGYPKDVNLYQASRAINYIANTSKPIIKKKGILIIAADLRDGIGKSSAEYRFYKTLRKMYSPSDFILKVKRRGFDLGEHRAYMVARPLMDYDIAFVTGGDKKFMTGLPFLHFTDMERALSYAVMEKGQTAKIFIVPRTFSTIASV